MLVLGLTNPCLLTNFAFVPSSPPPRPAPSYCPARCRQHDESECTRGARCNFMHIKRVSRSLLSDLRYDNRRRRDRSRSSDSESSYASRSRSRSPARRNGSSRGGKTAEESAAGAAVGGTDAAAGKETEEAQEAEAGAAAGAADADGIPEDKSEGLPPQSLAVEPAATAGGTA